MQRLKRIGLVVAMLVACVGCDQATKSLARNHLQGRETTSFLNDTLRLQYVENSGAFLGLGESLPHRWRTAAFTVGGAVMLAAVLVYAILGSKSGPLRIVTLSLISGGGIGNLVDRVRYDGHVTDFLNMGVGPIRTGIFNLADVALMTGMALLLLLHRGSEQPIHPASGNRPP